jgi:outer membrane lipoprotein-sorting protein
MMITSILALTGILLAQAPMTAEDAKTPQGILKKMDNVNNNYQDQEFVIRMTLSSEGKAEKVIEMKIWQKGGDKRLIRIEKPADVKGLSVLVEDANTAYVYLPQFNKTRRVAAHTNKQSFMGSDFTEQEMSIIRYDDAFDPALVEKQGEDYILKLTPKAGKEFDFAYIKVWIDQRDSFLTKLEYYNGENVKLKTQTRGEVKTLNGTVTQTKVVMTDHLKKHATEMDFLSLKENQGLKDELFTKRNLEWGK